MLQVAAVSSSGRIEEWEEAFPDFRVPSVISIIGWVRVSRNIATVEAARAVGNGAGAGRACRVLTEKKTGFGILAYKKLHHLFIAPMETSNLAPDEATRTLRYALSTQKA